MIINTRIRLALHHLKKGVIAHPTDTIYGLACLANNPSGIQKIIEHFCSNYLEFPEQSEIPILFFKEQKLKIKNK